MLPCDIILVTLKTARVRDVAGEMTPHGALWAGLEITPTMTGVLTVIPPTPQLFSPAVECSAAGRERSVPQAGSVQSRRPCLPVSWIPKGSYSDSASLVTGTPPSTLHNVAKRKKEWWWIQNCCFWLTFL